MNRRNFVVLTGALVLAACGPSKKASAAAELDAGKAFLATNAKAPGVVVLPSGLQYKIVRSGPADGMRPQKQDEVKVNYEGKLLNGTVFDSSYERGVPAAMPVDALIPAWVEALQLMRPGDEWMLYAPSNLAYGDEGQGSIPPGSTLIFRIELIAVLPGPGHTANG
jgi:FKBP-type peptidyl-prolyl cis-trans isomerase